MCYHTTFGKRKLNDNSAVTKNPGQNIRIVRKNNTQLFVERKYCKNGDR